MILFGLALCGGLLIISAFFSAAETALLSSPQQELKRLALRVPSLEKHVHLWITRPQKLIITILVGNTLTDVAFASGLTWIALKNLPRWPQRSTYALAWAAGALTTTLIGEILPKLLGRRRPDLFSRLAFPMLALFGKIFRPLLVCLEKALAPFLKAKPSDAVPRLRFSADELMTVLTDSDRGVEISPECLEMMKRTLEINKKLSRDIMTPLERVEFLDWSWIGSRGGGAIDLFIERGHTRVPVKKGASFVGYLEAKDILGIIVKTRAHPVNLQTMIRPLAAVDGERPVAELLGEFENRGIPLALVAGPNKQAIGLITQEDILEEIMGEILDEYDS
jgi:putative hemolysin